MGGDFQARGEAELTRNLAKLPLHAYLGSEQQLQEQLRLVEQQRPQLMASPKETALVAPREEKALLRDKGDREIGQKTKKSEAKSVLAKSFGSNLYMESKIEDIVGKYVNLMEVRKFYRSQKELYPELQEDIKALKESPGVRRVERSDGAELVVRSPRVSINLVKDRARLFVTLSDHKQGGRALKGWGSIKENVVHGLLPYVVREEQTQYWDPFCGSGTLVI